LGSDILTPLHDAPEEAQGQLLIHLSGHKERDAEGHRKRQRTESDNSN
jgi:hypothetical protein